MKKRVVIFFASLVFLILGIIPLFHLEAPGFFYSQAFLEIIMLVAGILIVYLTMKESKKNLINLVIGISLILLGLFPMVINSRTINFSFIPILSIRTTILALILVLFGVYLAIESFLSD